MAKFGSAVLVILLALAIFCGITLLCTFAINIIAVSFGFAKVSKLVVGAGVFLAFVIRTIFK